MTASGLWELAGLVAAWVGLVVVVLLGMIVIVILLAALRAGVKELRAGNRSVSIFKSGGRRE